MRNDVFLVWLPWLIVLAHLIGDFVCQTHEQSQHKPHDWAALAGHVATYHIPMGAVALAAWGFSVSTAVFMAVSVVTHAWFDRRWPIVWLIRATGSAPFASWSNGMGLMIFDQTAHFTALTAGLILAIALH